MTASHRARIASAALACLALAACSSATTNRPAATVQAHPAAAAGPADTTARRVVAGVKVGSKIGPLAVGDNWLWATNDNGTVVGQGSNGTQPALLRLDPSTAAVSATATLPTNPFAVLVSGGVVYVQLEKALLTVDPASMRVTAQYPLPDEGPASMVATPGGLWLGFFRGGNVVRFDVATHAVTATLTLVPAATAQADQDGFNPGTLAYVAGSVWAPLHATSNIARIDPAAARVTASYPLPAGTGDFVAAAADGSIWLATDQHPVHLDTATGATTVLTASVPQASNLVSRGNDLWLAGGDGRLYRVDVAADRVLETVRITGRVVDLTEDGGILWLATLANDLTRIDVR